MSQHADPIAAADRFWSLGDYSVVAPHLEPVAQAMVAAAGIEPGWRVLDVAAGTGNAGLAAAAAGGRVTALEPTAVLRDHGARRAVAAGVDISWVAGHAQQLPFAAGSFDAAISSLGAMFASDPEAATAELARVVRPGGRVALAAWRYVGIAQSLHRVLAEVTGQPLGVVGAYRWGVPDNLERWWGAGARAWRHLEGESPWRAADPEALVATLETASAPFVAVRSGLGEGAWGPVRARILRAVEEYARPDGADVVVDWPYLISTATTVASPPAR